MTTLVDAVDYWCNAFFPDREAVWQRAIDNQGLSLVVRRRGDEFCTAAQMVERLDSSGFATVVLVVSAPAAPQDADTDLFEHVACRAEEIAALAEQYPTRFRGLWSVDPTTGPTGVAQAAEALGRPWCIGLHNHTHSWDRAFDHPDFEPFYRLCVEHDVPFVMQAGASGGNFPSECGRPGSIVRPATDHPSLRFVLSHTGWPWTTETVAVAAELDNVYVGTATWPLRRWPTELRSFAMGVGRTKVVFGTGFPTTGHRQAARQFADPELTSGLSVDLVARITAQNARDIFTRLPTPTGSGTT